MPSRPSGVAGDGAAQVLGYELDRLQVEHVGHFPGGLGGVALDGVGQGVHTGAGGEALGHGAHHLGVDNGADGHVVGVDADELAALLHVGDDVVDGDLGGGTGGGGYGDDGRAGVLGGRGALEGTHVGELGVGDDDADGLGGVHRAAAAYGDDVVGAGGLVGLDTGLDVLYGRVGLDVGEYLVGQALGVEAVGHVGDHAVLEDARAADDKRLLEAAGLDLARDFADSTRAVIGSLVEHDTVGHLWFLLKYSEFFDYQCYAPPPGRYAAAGARFSARVNYITPGRQVK